MLFPDDETVVVAVAIAVVGRLWGMRQHAGVRRTPRSRSCSRPSPHGRPPDGGEHHRGWRSCGSGAVNGWARDPSSGSVRASYTWSSMSSSSSRGPPLRPRPSRQRRQKVVETAVQIIARWRRLHGAGVCHSLSVSSPCSNLNSRHKLFRDGGKGGRAGGAVKKKNNRSPLLLNTTSSKTPCPPSRDPRQGVKLSDAHCYVV